MQHSTVYLKDYQAPAFQILNVELCFEIKSMEDVLVTNQMHLIRQSGGECILDGEDLDCVEILLNNEALSPHQYQFIEQGLQLFDCPDEFHLSITTRLNPSLNTALSGLYASRIMLCTQCEAQGFRRISYFLDRPDVLSRFKTKIIAPKTLFPILLSNGNCLEKGIIDDNQHYAIWEDPFLKPCYLFALVVGDLASVSDEFITASGRCIHLEIFVEKGDEHLCSYAMQSIKHAMKWDELRFGREYDLDQYMVVAVKDFNMGAMENKGLNIFNSKYVLADENTATDDDILGIESVIGHEYFHNWTGNRVTCRDWFQLSLKEGLTIYRDQSFSADMNDATWQRISDVMNLRRVQFPEDRGALAHSVQPKSYQEINNFYTATVYEKGGEIVRMYETILGRDGFRKGMDLYFSRHDGQAVTIEDFLHAMEDANNINLKQFQRWYDQIGTPIVEVNEIITAQQLKIELTQNNQPPLLIPIRFKVYSLDGHGLNLPEVLLLEQSKQKFVFDIPHANIVVNYLQGFSAPIILKRKLTLEQKLIILKVEQDGFALWDLMQNILVDFVQKAYLYEEEITIPEELIGIMQGWIKNKDYFVLLTQLCSVPSFEECMLGLKEVDPVALESCRQQLEFKLAKALYSEFVYEEPRASENSYDRAWRNLCWHYLIQVEPSIWAEKCLSYFRQAQNMTDRMAAIKALMHHVSSAEARLALQQFYHEWNKDELVMDKWFALQGKHQSLSEILKLIGHPLFHWENPNKVRALVGSFTQNITVFHQKDGEGYRWLTQAILILDSINPQVAARMVTPFTRWQDYDLTRQLLMQKELKFLAKHDLSPNVSEMVLKALEGIQ